jgi:hypothetical protein
MNAGKSELEGLKNLSGYPGISLLMYGLNS